MICLCRSLWVVLILAFTTSSARGQDAEANAPPSFDELPEAIQEEILRLREEQAVENEAARGADIVIAPGVTVSAPTRTPPFIPVAREQEGGAVQIVEY